MGGTVSAKTVGATLGAARALGLDADALAKTHGVAAALTDIDSRHAHDAWLGLWRDLIRLTGNESVGLEAAERLPWGHFDVIDYVIGTSEDFGSALRRLERYFALVSTGVRHTIEEHGDAVHLMRRYAPGCHTRLLAPAEFAFANIVLRTRAPLGVPWRPREVRFATPPPTSDAPHRKLFGCPVRFEAEDSEIVIERATLALPMQRPDANLRAILERHAGMLMGGLATHDQPLDRVHTVILEGLQYGDVSVNRAARCLGMSARSLQRTLQTTGQSFDKLLDSSRRALARSYLQDASLSIQEIAQLLSFRDLRGFYRAFNRWEGCPPAEFRKRRALTR